MSTSASTSDLFIDLFAYRQRENKDPLEDWLTECLAVTMRALPNAAKAQLLAELSGADISDPETFLDRHRVEIVTQHRTDTAGRPDMLVMLDDHPWILFENKVGHGVGSRDAENDEPNHQLRDYANWLARNGADCTLPRAIVFVTHVTPPPHDFREALAAGAYCGLRPVHMSWGALGRRIAGLLEHHLPDHHAKALASAFLAYLEDQNMSNEFPTSTAFAAAQVYLTQAAELENLITHMWNELKTVASFGKTSDVRLKALPDEGAICAWRYVAPGPSSSSRDSYLQTGIWFPDLVSWFSDREATRGLHGPQVHVYFGNDYSVFGSVTGQPEGFLRPDGDFLACKALNEFAADPQTRGEEIIAWVGARAAELRECLLSHGLIRA